MYEHHQTPLLPRRVFYRRVGRHAVIAVAILLAALGVGMVGYHHFEGVPWIDAYVDAAMILSGMGPLGDLHTDGGKIFAGCYALFSGVVFLSTIGVFLAPIVHRLFHKFHMAEESSDPPAKSK
jgi:hypothetical protein